MPRRLTPEEKYRLSIRKQQKTLEEYAAHEIEWADDLLYWYGIQNIDIPTDVYRAVAFFKNKEFQKKPGSLSLMYNIYLRCIDELPTPTKELAFDLLVFRYRKYAAALKAGGFDGRTDW